MFGKNDFNVLKVAITFGDSRLHLFGSFLPTSGNYSYGQRKQILERATRLIWKDRIKMSCCQPGVWQLEDIQMSEGRAK